MKHAMLGAVALAAFPALAASQEPAAEKAASGLSTVQASVIVRAMDQGKAVPRNDKDAVELIGTVSESYSITDPCTGNPVRVVWVTSRAAPMNPVGGGGAGPSFNACAALRPGQRVRLQGTLLTLPDPIGLGFNACDPETWFLPVIPLQTFLVTKVAK